VTGLSHAEAQKIIDADNKALMDRVEAGKPLTAEQRRRVENMAAGSVHAGETKVTSIDALAKALEVTRQSVHNWLKIDGNPGRSANGQYDVAAWRVWVNIHGRKGAEQTDEKKEWEARKAKADAQKAELELRRMNGELMDKAEVVEWLMNMTTPAVKMLTSMASVLSKKLGRKNAQEREKIINEYTRHVREQIAELPDKLNSK